MLYDEHPELLEEIATNNGVDIAVVREMLALHREFRNLHSYGARPALRRRLTEMVNQAARAPDAGDDAG